MNRGRAGEEEPKGSGGGMGNATTERGAGAKGIPNVNQSRTRLSPAFLSRAFPMAAASLSPAGASRSPGEETKAGWVGMDERELL